MKKRIKLTESDIHKIVNESVRNIRRLQRLGWVKENFTSKRRSVEDFGEPTPELNTTAFKNELTKLAKYLGMAQGNSKGIQYCIKMITQISKELKQHSGDADFNVKWMLQGLEQATKQLSNGQTRPAVKIVNQIIMEVDRTANAIKARPKKWNGGIMAESNLHKIVEKSVNRILNEVTESIGKKVTKGKSYWGDTKKHQTYDPYTDDEMRINYTGGRPGVMWDADETPLKYK